MMDVVAVIVGIVTLTAINMLFFRWGYTRGFIEGKKQGYATAKDHVERAYHTVRLRAEHASKGYGKESDSESP